MEKHIDYYLELISPNNIIDSFKTLVEFESFCETRSAEYLNDMLEDFTLHEKYEQCCVIRDTINDLQIKKLLRDK
tara:strand:- start:208 stop:432 length:225 start_codon:yes stop_codon:yes gene_type:complete